MSKLAFIVSLLIPSACVTNRMLKNRMKKSYYEKLKDPRWQKKRLEIMEDSKFECQNCGDDKNTLNVHHVIYRKNTDPWDYHNSLFKCLCEKCHEEWHDERAEFNENLATIECNSLGIEEFFWMADGIVFDRLLSLEEVQKSLKFRIQRLKEGKK